MTARPQRERSEEFTSRRTSIALWFALLGGPGAAFLNVLFGYAAVDRACVRDSSIILHLLTLLFLVIAVLAGLTAWRLYQRSGDWPLTEGGVLPRSRFMASVGLLASASGTLGILMQWVPVFFIGACHGT